MPVGISLVLLVSFSLGCFASFRAGDPQFDASRATSPASSSIDIGVDVFVPSGDHFSFGGNHREFEPQDLQDWKNRTRLSFEASGHFSRVHESTHEKGWKAKLEIAPKVRYFGLASILTLLTVGILPSKSDIELTIKTTFTRPDGKRLPPIIRKETFSDWAGWIVTPFYSSYQNVPKEIVSDLTRASLAEAIEKGYFDDAASPAPASRPVALDENGKPILPE